MVARVGCKVLWLVGMVCVVVGKIVLCIFPVNLGEVVVVG